MQNNEIKIYEIIGDNEFTSTFLGQIDCIDDRYLILEYKMEVPFEQFFVNNFTFNLVKNKIGEHVNKLLIDVLNSYSFLLSHKIIHNDMKPQNILLTNETKYILHDFDRSIIINEDYLLINVLKLINRDFLRFLNVFVNELNIINNDVIIVNPTYQNFNRAIKLIITNIKNDDLNYGSMDEYLKFIELNFNKIIKWGNRVNGGGKKLKSIFTGYRRQDGTYSASNRTNKTKRRLQSNFTRRRKRAGHLHWKPAITRKTL